MHGLFGKIPPIQPQVNQDWDEGLAFLVQLNVTDTGGQHPFLNQDIIQRL